MPAVSGNLHPIWDSAGFRIAERNCALRQAVEDGEISRSRYESYCRMFEEAKGLKEWELKKN